MWTNYFFEELAQELNFDFKDWQQYVDVLFENNIDTVDDLKLLTRKNLIEDFKIPVDVVELISAKLGIQEIQIGLEIGNDMKEMISKWQIEKQRKFEFGRKFTQT